MLIWAAVRLCLDLVSYLCKKIVTLPFMSSNPINSSDLDYYDLQLIDSGKKFKKLVNNEKHSLIMEEREILFYNILLFWNKQTNNDRIIIFLPSTLKWFKSKYKGNFCKFPEAIIGITLQQRIYLCRQKPLYRKVCRKIQKLSTTHTQCLHSTEINKEIKIWYNQTFLKQ